VENKSGHRNVGRKRRSPRHIRWFQLLCVCEATNAWSMINQTKKMMFFAENIVSSGENKNIRR
jgi:hypothetical protein